MSDNDTKVHETDEHLRPLEREARILCKMRMADPDARIPVPHPGGLAVVIRRSQWLFAADEILAIRQCLMAMRLAQEPDGAANDERPRIIQPH